MVRFWQQYVMWHAAAHLKKLSTKPLTKDPTGQLTAAHLRLEGSLIKSQNKDFPGRYTKNVELERKIANSVGTS